MITVRLFAAAAEAAGVDTEQVAATTAGELRDALSARHGDDLRRVLARCSLLVDGRVATAEDPLPEGVVVDVLPPFAGG